MNFWEQNCLLLPDIIGCLGRIVFHLYVHIQSNWLYGHHVITDSLLSCS